MSTRSFAVRRRSPLLALGLIAGLCAALLPATAAHSQDADGPIFDPLPDPELSDLGIVLEEFAQLPESDPSSGTVTDRRLMRHNRINYLGEMPDGSGRLYVPDLNGKLYLLDHDGDHTEYLDVESHFAEHWHDHRGLGTGFGFVAFHPEFADNGRFYTVHTESGGAIAEHEPDLPVFRRQDTQGIITEWTADDPSADTFSGTNRQVLRVGFATQIHGFQQIGFNPTARPGDADHGLLYIAVGDGGNAVGNDNPQDLSTPHGKLFRIDPLGSNSSNGQYGIPDDNPFVDTEGALGEIWAYGFRDPHRFSWDPQAGNRMFLGDIGEWQIEEINEIRPGHNYGWSHREGPFEVRADRQLYPLPEDDAELGYTYPVAAYDHNREPGQTGDLGVAVVGGFVYRGKALPALRGHYILGDIVDGGMAHVKAAHLRIEDEELAPLQELRIFDTDGNETGLQEMIGDSRVDLRLGIDGAGELYVLSKGAGTIWRVVDTVTVKRDRDPVLPSLRDDVVAHYGFETPTPGAPTFEQDLGRSGTDIELVNGGNRMRVADGAFPGSTRSLQTKQVSPDTASNDDWKAGIFDADGVESLDAFAGAEAVTVMGWFKPMDEHPRPNSNTANSDDRFNATGLAGVLSGDSDGHGVRALLEIIDVRGEQRLVALGRRLDGRSSMIFAASEDWEELVPRDEWTHLVATFDFDAGEMALFRNGERLDGFYTAGGDPWGVGGGDGPYATSPTLPTGIKIGGSYPQNTREQNPCTCRMDALMFLDRVPTDAEIAAQYARFVDGRRR